MRYLFLIMFIFYLLLFSVIVVYELKHQQRILNIKNNTVIIK